MQFTGLHDRNGTEIYEGDIVFETGYGNNVIEWCGVGWGYKSKNGYRILPYIYTCEVIGNIHEDPELLK